MRTQKPTLRITRWLRSRKESIPFEAECTACSNAQFKIRYDKRSELSWSVVLSVYPPYAPPDGDRYMSVLQRDFEQHLKSVHADEYAEMQKILSGLSAVKKLD